MSLDKRAENPPKPNAAKVQVFLHISLPFPGFQLWGRVPWDEEECSHGMHVTQDCKRNHKLLKDACTPCDHTSHFQTPSLPKSQHPPQNPTRNQPNSHYSQEIKSLSTQRFPAKRDSKERLQGKNKYNFLHIFYIYSFGRT